MTIVLFKLCTTPLVHSL